MAYPNMRGYHFRCKNVNPVYLNQINRSTLDVYTVTVYSDDADPMKAAKRASGYRGRAKVTQDGDHYVVTANGQEIAKVIITEIVNR